MFAKVALVDPELTRTVPPQVVASTGLDVLSHALEGYWSVNHQPVCDAVAIYAAKLAFENLYRAYQDGNDMEAKENMSLASLMAGIAFGQPKTPHHMPVLSLLPIYIICRMVRRARLPWTHCFVLIVKRMGSVWKPLRKWWASPMWMQWPMRFIP